MTACGDVGKRVRGSSEVGGRVERIGWFGHATGLPNIAADVERTHYSDGGRQARRKDSRVMDLREREAAERERHRQQVDEFLRDATRDVERMRGLLPELEAGDAAAWARVQNLAHNLAARSLALKLGVMNACARELVQLTDEQQNGAPLDDFFRQCVGSAIETLALEVDGLKRT
jgi:hypothetical protein